MAVFHTTQGTELRTTPHYRLLFTGLVFVVVLLLALVLLPPLANAQADAIRTQIDGTVLNFAEALTAIEDDVQQMQAATRGYVLTREPLFLEHYRIARDALPTRLSTLAELAPQVDSAFVMPTADLAETVLRWQRERSDVQIQLAAQGRTQEVTAAIASGGSQALFDSVRSRVDELQQQTVATKQALQAQLQGMRTLQVGLMSGLGTLGLCAVVFVIIGFRRMLALMQELQEAREQSARLAGIARTERRRLQTVFDHTSAAIVLAEMPNGQITLTNPAATALFGPDLTGSLAAHPLMERIFRPGGERCVPKDFPALRSLREGITCHDVELIIEQPDRQRVPVLITSVPLPSEEGTPQGVVIVVQDLRRLREVERLKSDFVALVSHELRTPLTAIQGCAQTLLNGVVSPTPERVQQFMQIIAEQGERLQELIDNLLSLAQVEAGALRLHRTQVEIGPLVQSVLRQLRERFTDVRLQADLAPDLPPITADSRRIEQVLFNLLDNARKFSPPDGTITIQVEAVGRLVRFRVRDQGPGIPLAARERIFERFYQIEQPSTRNVGGTGLGLAICQAIVNAHGGTIRVEEMAGPGATLTFTIPSHTREPALPIAMPLRRDSGTTRILVVDDDPAIRRLLEGSLSDEGYRVQTVGDAEAVFQATVQQPPDLILLDMMLPGSDGFAICRQLREWTQVPIIMLTVRAAEQDVVQALAIGADDYVTKPFRPSELTARIEAVLRRARTDIQPDAPALVEIGDLCINLVRREVSLAGQPVELTPTEYRILTYLARHVGQVLTHDQILSEIWGDAYRGSSHYLWVHMARLRQKLEPDGRQPRYIRTERGIGYRLARPQPRTQPTAHEAVE